MEDEKPVVSNSKSDLRNAQGTSVLNEDSFEEFKGDVVDYDAEPVFSTASGVLINVRAESIAKSKIMLETTSSAQRSSTGKSKTNSTTFVSPFRGSSVSIQKNVNPSGALSTMKRSVPIEIKKETASNEPKTKRSSECSALESVNSENTLDIIGTALRIEEIPEASEIRVVLQDEISKNLILVHFDSKMPTKIEFRDKIQLKNAKIVRKCTENVQVVQATRIEKIGTSPDSIEHPFNKKPFIREPIFIYELEPRKNSKDIAILKVNIVDFGPKFYNGCSKCHYRFNGKHNRNDPLPKNCPKCGEIAKKLRCVYSLIRVIDYSGQIQLHVSHEVMLLFLRKCGYHEIEDMDKFSNLSEQMSYIFKPVMIRIQRKKHGENESWHALEIEDVDWESYSEALERRVMNSELVGEK